MSSSEERPSPNASANRSWRERLLHLLQIAPNDRDELLQILRKGQQGGLFDANTLGMLEGVLDVTEMQVEEIMIPRAQMAVVRRDDNLATLLSEVVVSGFSRYPVVGEHRDEIVGVLIAKDLLRYFPSAHGEAAFNLQDILRPASFVPEGKRLNVLLREFQSSRSHIAIVVDEYGGVSGLVTIEDILEQIVGEIEDEHDEQEEDNILQHGEHRYLVKGLTDLDEFNAALGAQFSDAEFDTVAGLLINAFGHLPHRGERVRLGHYEFTVVRADNRRIHLVQVCILPEADVQSANA
ncbi:MAG: transporter associated domain-containing protein [Pseudomonadota bacterium]|nr:transporter associated domain-containing protein [Pseudomonadota bacterium]